MFTFQLVIQKILKNIIFRGKTITMNNNLIIESVSNGPLFGQTFITPISFSKALSPFHKNRGAAGALYAGFQYLISFIVTTIISLFTIKGVTILSVSYVLLSMIGITVFYWLINNKHHLNTLHERLPSQKLF